MKIFRLVLYICIGLLALYIINAVYFSSSAFLETTAINAGLAGIYLLSALTISALVYFPIRYLVKHPRSGLKGLVIFIAALLIFFIGYALSPGEVDTGLKSTWASKFLDGALILMYGLFAIILVTIIYTEVRNLFR